MQAGRRPATAPTASRPRRARAPDALATGAKSSLVVRTVGEALRVACRCAGSPTSSFVAPSGQRFAPGTINGRRGAVELDRRPFGRRWSELGSSAVRFRRCAAIRSSSVGCRRDLVLRGRVLRGPALLASGRGTVRCSAVGCSRSGWTLQVRSGAPRSGAGRSGAPRSGAPRSGAGRSGAPRSVRLGRALLGPVRHGRVRHGQDRGRRSSVGCAAVGVDAAAARTDGRDRALPAALDPRRPGERRAPRDPVPELARARTGAATDRPTAMARRVAPTDGRTVGRLARARTAPDERPPAREPIDRPRARAAPRARRRVEGPGVMVPFGARRAVARAGTRRLATARSPARTSGAGGDRAHAGARRSAPSGPRRPPSDGPRDQRGPRGPRQGRSTSVVLPRGASPRTPPVEAPDRREVPVWIDEGSVRAEAARATERAAATTTTGTRRRRRLPNDVVAELERAAGRDSRATARSPPAGGPCRLRGRAVPGRRSDPRPAGHRGPGGGGGAGAQRAHLLPARPLEEGDGRARGLPSPDRGGRSASGPGRQLPRAAAMGGGGRAVDGAAGGVAVGRAGDGGPHRGGRARWPIVAG